eukprot:1176530-Prorocentrum_minimum.AAC.2
MVRLVLRIGGVDFNRRVASRVRTGSVVASSVVSSRSTRVRTGVSGWRQVSLNPVQAPSL